MSEIFDGLTILLILIFIIWAFMEYTFFMFVVLFLILFLLYKILKKDLDDSPSAYRETAVEEGSVFLNPAKQAEYDIQKKKESEINQQQQKEFEKVAKKYARKNNNRANKSQLDKNFAETGKYESDKSRESREINELKKANNYKRKNGWFGYQHLGDWNDK
tara:strand:+ start:130 stop:612 length:483 start_codon:yes stop_codon:yes gene_type:complete